MMKLKILIIEDEKKIADIVSAYLKKEGYIVNVALTGVDGLNKLKETPDLIVLDLMLPDMDGEDICKTIRQSSDVPIIMLTAKSREDERIKGLLMGADDYVVKPFSPKELVARVGVILKRAGKKEKVITFNNGRLLINKSTNEIKKDDKVITLTQTEFSILTVLSENAGRVLNREQIVNLCLGHDFEGFERTIDAHIKNLRQKIEINPRKPEFIKTIYGLGYKFTGVKDED